MSGVDLLTDLQQTIREMDKALYALRPAGDKLAGATRDYQVALAKEQLKEREAGLPATLISDMSRGDSTVADLRFARDCADVNYGAVQESINVWKLKARLLEAQISREWGRSD
jgi:hypothetical protein